MLYNAANRESKFKFTKNGGTQTDEFRPESYQPFDLEPWTFWNTLPEQSSPLTADTHLARLMFRDIEHLNDSPVRCRMIYTLLSRLEKYMTCQEQYQKLKTKGRKIAVRSNILGRTNWTKYKRCVSAGEKLDYFCSGLVIGLGPLSSNKYDVLL